MAARTRSINGTSLLGSGDIPLESFATGDIILSSREITAPEWLPADGSLFLQSSYPDVFALVGLLSDGRVKLANPSTIPVGTGRGCAFSSDGMYLSVAHDASPYITIYKRSGDTFTKLADPSTLPAGNARCCAFSSDGTYLAVAESSSPYIMIYKRSGDTFTKLADPSFLPSGVGVGCSFSPDGTYLAVAYGSLPYIMIYKMISYDMATTFCTPSIDCGVNAYIKT